ncbi:MAG: anthranilate synthase component I family protein [Salibacteraceae bacterium]
MRNSIWFSIDDSFDEKLTLWLEKQSIGVCFKGDGWNIDGKLLAGFGQIQRIASDQPADIISFCEHSNDYVFCHLTYDVKNALEKLESTGQDHCIFPLFASFIPEVVITVKGKDACYHYYPHIQSVAGLESIHQEIQAIDINDIPAAFGDLPVKQRTSKEEYLEALGQIQAHIKQGNIYQANFCHEFYWTSVSLSGAHAFNSGFRAFPNPFSAYYKTPYKQLICFSPERFLSIDQNTITSQPMKGTAPRGDNPADDEALKQALSNSEKERRENVMIVDMVRNDLSHYAEKGSVKVPELYRIQTYPKVHQMYSTVTAQLKAQTPLMAALLKAFPMGSMTGAPKVRAMQILDELEPTKRGIYSGTVGFITPNGSADFNVVIRSLVYNQSRHYLSCHAGGGITALSNSLDEYEESLLKARPLIDLMNGLLSKKPASVLPLPNEGLVD